jgi:hypothetical protein
LFASDPEGNGLGNRHDRLGRFYTCHFENFSAKLTTKSPVAFNFEKTRDGVYARRKLQFSASAQRKHRLLNGSFRLHFPEYSDASHGSSVLSAIFLVKSAVIPEYRSILQHGEAAPFTSRKRSHLSNVLSGLPELAKFAYDRVFHGVLARRKMPYTLIGGAGGVYPLEYNSEQSPLECSRVTPDDNVDRDGIRGVHVDWHISSDDVDAAKRAFNVLRTALNQTSGCHVNFDDQQLGEDLRHAVPIGGHHIGTARMASSTRQGVVDKNCAVHGSRNLYVASAAVFPTSSHANPTLTVVAMAIRLAERLKHIAARPEILLTRRHPPRATCAKAPQSAR